MTSNIPASLKPVPKLGTFPFKFAPKDMDTLRRVEVLPDNGRTYLWNAERLAEVVARLVFAAEDGDTAASDLAVFLLFVTVGDPVGEA
jgi:hypothetical protein